VYSKLFKTIFHPEMFSQHVPDLGVYRIHPDKKKKKLLYRHVLKNHSSNLHTFPNSIQLSFWLFLSDIQYPMTIDDDRLSLSVISATAIIRLDRHTDIVFVARQLHTGQVACARFTCQQTNVAAMHICDSSFRTEYKLLLFI